MEILYGVILLVTFILGLGIGISVPFFVKKYVKYCKEENKEEKPTIPTNKSMEKNDEASIPFNPTDLLREWVTGEEVKPSDK